MPAAPNFKEASIGAMTLAKISGPNGTLQASKALCRFRDEEAEHLAPIFLRGFRALDPHRLHHHSHLDGNELYTYAKKLFNSPESLLEVGGHIAAHLQSQSHHPNIKPGDLCVAVVDGITLENEPVQALCIIKSESQVPFLQISIRDGDLRLTTEQGIYPEKIDKGILILDVEPEEGFTVYLFDKAGSGTHFWKRDFAGAVPVKDAEYLTKRYSQMCVAFAEKGLPEESKPEERVEVARRAIEYLQETEDFDLAEFQEAALPGQEMQDQFNTFKTQYQEETGHELEEQFPVSKKEAKKAKKRLKSRLKLDVGVDMKFSSGFIDKSEQLLERGFDEDKHMSYLKVYFHREEGA
jgi:hypothetical protein